MKYNTYIHIFLGQKIGNMSTNIKFNLKGEKMEYFWLVGVCLFGCFEIKLNCIHTLNMYLLKFTFILKYC